MAINIQLIKDSLELFQSRREQIRTRFYQTLFEENPKLAAEFNEEERAVFREFIDRALAAIVTLWHSPDKLEAKLTQLGRQYHRSYLKAEYCSIYGEVMVAALDEVLGPDLPKKALEAWDEIIGLGLAIIQSAWSTMAVREKSTSS